MSTMHVNTLAPWYGSNRTSRMTAGVQLGKLIWCGVPCVGGAPELPGIDTRTGLAADLHRHIINLSRVVSDSGLNAQLMARLDNVLFHPDELAGAQRRCIARERRCEGGLFGTVAARDEKPDVEWAADYFMCAWMGRGGHAGKKTEFTQNLSVRWTASGGDSAVRFRNARASLPAWNEALKCWQFNLCDIFDFLMDVVDRPGHGLFIDVPWPDAGDEYAFPFTLKQHLRLAKILAEYKHVRIVIRYGDHPQIREIYSGSHWNLLFNTTRTQQNTDCEEVLILNGPSFASNDAAELVESDHGK